MNNDNDRNKSCVELEDPGGGSAEFGGTTMRRLHNGMTETLVLSLAYNIMLTPVTGFPDHHRPWSTIL